MCEVLLTDMTPHPSNNRSACAAAAEKYGSFDTWFGIEQEYTYFDGIKPLGWPDNGFPAPQGGYYCGVGSDEVFGRPIVEAHLDACIEAGLQIAGINGEVMPGQWEFQIGPIGAPAVADHLWVARWLLYRIAEEFDVSATLDPKQSGAIGMGQELTLISLLSRCVKVMTLVSLPQKLWVRKLIFMWLIMVTGLKRGLQDFM